MARFTADETLRAFFDAAPIGKLIVGLDGAIVRANPAFCDFIGYAEAELVGRNLRDISHPDDLRNDLAENLRLVAGQIQSYGFERRYLRRDGSLATGQLNVWLMRDGKGAPRYLIGQVLDLTRRKAAEHALVEAKERAEIASRAKSVFLAHMSHELRTPLNAVLGFSELLDAEIAGTLTDKQREYVRDIHHSASHLLRLINDILDISKIEAGKLELADEVVDITPLIDACLSLVSPPARLKGLGLSVLHEAEEPPLLRADGLRVKQALVNLLTNAVKFTQAGGSIEIQTGTDAGGGFAVRVIDTGCGMSPEDLARAMEPFGQAKALVGKPREGTGLGLPLARLLIEAHGGKLDVDTAEGRGTTVTMVFPPDRVLPLDDLAARHALAS